MAELALVDTNLYMKCGPYSNPLFRFLGGCWYIGLSYIDAWIKRPLKIEVCQAIAKGVRIWIQPITIRLRDWVCVILWQTKWTWNWVFDRHGRGDQLVREWRLLQLMKRWLGDAKQWLVVVFQVNNKSSRNGSSISCSIAFSKLKAKPEG